MVFDGRVKNESGRIVLQAENRGILNNISIDMHILEGSDRKPTKKVPERMLGWYHAWRFYLVLMFVNWKRTNKRKLIDLPDHNIWLNVKSNEHIAVGDDIQLYEVVVADDFVDQGLDVGIPDADWVVVGGCEEQDQTLVEGHTGYWPGMLFVFEFFCLRYCVPKDQFSIIAACR